MGNNLKGNDVGFSILYEPFSTIINNKIGVNVSWNVTSGICHLYGIKNAAK